MREAELGSDGTKNFIDASFSIIVELENPSAANDTAGNFVSWLDDVLASYELNWKLSVDLKYYDEEERSLPLGDTHHVTINLAISDWNFNVTEDGDEPSWQGLYRSDLERLSTEELVKGALRNLWSHMGDYQL